MINEVSNNNMVNGGNTSVYPTTSHQPTIGKQPTASPAIDVDHSSKSGHCGQNPSCSTEHEQNVSNSPPTKKRRGRQSSYTDVEDLYICRNVLALKAHIAKHGTKKHLFEKIVENLSKLDIWTRQCTWKGVSDRYNLLQDKFNEEKYNKLVESGNTAEIKELDKLLASMRYMPEEPDCSFPQENGNIVSGKQRLDIGCQTSNDHAIEGNLEQPGANGILSPHKMPHDAPKHAAAVVPDESCLGPNTSLPLPPVPPHGSVQQQPPNAVANSTTNEETNSGDRNCVVTPPTQRFHRRQRQVTCEQEKFGYDADRFGALLYQTTTAQIELEKERLDVEKQRISMEIEHWRQDREERLAKEEKDREERKEERESKARLELEKFKLLMETIQTIRK